MRRLLALLLAVSPLAAPAPSRAAGHCAPYTVTPVPGDPDAFRITTARASTVARRDRTPARPAAVNELAVIHVFPSSFDVDGDSLGTSRDTLVVAPGTLVRWVRRGPGFHTVTNGFDSGDLSAASEYNFIFDEPVQSVERVFNTPGFHNYFCFIHEPVMSGTILVTSATADVPRGPITRVRFLKLPSPNPARDALSFSVALPHSTRLSVTVHDLTGRSVATLADGMYPIGENSFRWTGRDRSGRVVAAGRYFITLAAAGVRETRAVSLVR